MTTLKALIIALGVIWLPVAVQAADEADKPSDAQAAPKCLEAAVNPVTGYTFCVNPRGAPVEPPPAAAYNRPCKPRAHDNDPWTIYEHGSGCN